MVGEHKDKKREMLMTAQELREILKEAHAGELLLLDVREADEFRDQPLLPDSPAWYINISLTVLAVLPKNELVEQLEEKCQALGSHLSDVRIVAVCRSGNRSRLAVEVLAKHGIHSENLEGGVVGFEGKSV
jgi:rhodanese-related sulfurtransferase